MEPDPLVGWSIAGRRLEALIGEGAQAYVYRASHLELGRTEVIKVLKRSTGSMSPKRFTREARSMARMSSSHLVQIYDYGHTAEGEHFLVMEYVDGRPLNEVIERYERLPIARAMAIAEQICLALAEAHRYDIIHRDVKPENVLLERRGATGDHVRLVDFGVAHDQMANLTLPGRIFGTPGYLAPEQLQSQPLDARSDLFSVGVLVYEMLSGHNPFQVHGDTPMEQLSCLWRLLKAPVPPLSTVVNGVPPALDALVAGLMAREPNDRPADAASVALQFVEIRLSMGNAGSHNPSLSALQAELGEQARLLDARREALEARKRVLDRVETRVAAAQSVLSASEDARRHAERHAAAHAQRERRLTPSHPGLRRMHTPAHGEATHAQATHGQPARLHHQPSGHGPVMARHTPPHGLPSSPPTPSSLDQRMPSPVTSAPRPSAASQAWLLFAALLLAAVVSGTMVVAARYGGVRQAKVTAPGPAPVEPGVRRPARPAHRMATPPLAPPRQPTSVVRQR